ncbi:hypothetical protein GCM10010289_58860 [Streptomyces violascens]|nr:hypothetical protein GCM10010289_58860 [Streptomyces violascens]
MESRENPARAVKDDADPECDVRGWRSGGTRSARDPCTAVRGGGGSRFGRSVLSTGVLGVAVHTVSGDCAGVTAAGSRNFPDFEASYWWRKAAASSGRMRASVTMPVVITSATSSWT